jgi:hypothetical protein
MSQKTKSKPVDEEPEETNTESENENDEVEEEDDDERVPIDLSDNEIYRGVCTLLEDDEGNNILEYISLLHTELIGINKSLEHLRGVRKELTRIADCSELLLKAQKLDVPQQKSSDEKKSSKTKTVTQA